MKIGKRVLALFFALIMLFALVACDSDASKDPENTGKPADSTSGDQQGDKEALKDYSKKMKISFASIQVDDTVDYNAGDELAKWWSETYNVEWDITSLTWDIWAERLRIWINSGDMTDMATWNYLHGEAVTYADQGLVKKLPDDWKNRWPNLAKAYADTPINEAVEEALGGTYFMCKPVFSVNRPAAKLSPHISVYFRKDWAQAVGFEIKDSYTTNELLELARLLKEKDPGSVGKNFYPLVVNSGMASFLVQFNSTHALSDLYYKGDDGTYQWGPASQDTLEGLKVYKSFYDEGLLHPEFYTLQDPDDRAALYVTGTSGMFIGEGMAAWMTRIEQNMKDNLGLEYDDVIHAAVVTGNDGKYHCPPVLNYWTSVIFSPDIEDEKLERILDMFDYSCTEEGQLMVRIGFEDVDWKRNEAGEIESLLDIPATEKYKTIHPVYGNMFILSDDFQFINPGFKKEFRDKVKSMYVLREKLGDDKTMPEVDWTSHFHSSTALNLSSLNYADEYAQLVVKDGDIEENWKAWVNEKMPIIQPVIDELNAK